MKSETEDSKAETGADEVILEELKDPMSGYASADALDSKSNESSDEVERDHRLRDPMSGYTSGDSLAPESRVNEEGVDRQHADEMKDAMSGYASADALESD